MDSTARKPSGQYYWGQQWTVRPHLGVQTSKPVQRSTAPIVGRSATNPYERAGAEIPVQSWPEWVEEWHALQDAAGDVASQEVENHGAEYQTSDITRAAADPLLKQVITARRRQLVLPDAVLYGGAIVLVCVAVFAVWQLGTSKSLSRSASIAALVHEKSPIADPTEPMVKPENVAVKDSSSKVAALVMDDQSAPTNGGAKSKPSSADSASPVPVEIADVTSQFERSFQPAVSDSSNPSAQEASDRNNNRPHTASSGGVNAGQSDELRPMRKLAAESTGERPKIVLKGAPTGAAPEARSRPMRPGANLVSPEPITRIPVPSPPAAYATSQPAPEAAGVIDPGPAEAAVSRVAATANGAGGPSSVSTEPVFTMTARDAPSTRLSTAALLSRGDALFERGDIASARLFYEHAAEAGDAQAAIRLGETFDPAFLLRAQLKGVRSDSAVALKWYKRAQELGASDAEILVMSLQRN